MNSKPQDICCNPPFKKTSKYEGVIDLKSIREIYRKIQANASNIYSELGRGHHGILGISMKPSTYQTITGQ